MTSYHNKIDSFPGLVVAKMGSFPHRELFEADESARAVPRVQVLIRGPVVVRTPPQP